MLAVDMALLIPFIILHPHCGKSLDTNAFIVLGFLIAFKVLLVIAGVRIAYLSRGVALPR